MSGSAWLPRELVGVQPYSMGPVSRWDPEVVRLMPSLGGLRRMDPGGPEMSIAACLVAPAEIQRMARATGERAIIMRRPAGLAEAFERNRRR